MNVIMHEGGRYEEFCLALELYGHLLSLATRPISKGNAVAFHRAREAIATLLDALKGTDHTLIGRDRLAMVEHILMLSEAIPYKNRAGTVLRLLNDSLAGRGRCCADYIRLPQAGFVPSPALRRIVVALGPTIGLGDEFLVARAIVAKARAANLSLHVETCHFALWECFGGPVALLGPPPSAKFAFLSRLTAAEKQSTALVHVDFLAGDPTMAPATPSDLFTYTGRWAFGNATGVIVEPQPRRIYYLNCPTELSLSRPLQSDWMASRFISSSQTQDECRRGTLGSPCKGREPVILLQALTSKPRLLLSGQFYRDCLVRLRERCRGRTFLVRMLSGPARESHEIAQGIHRMLVRALGRGQVEMVPTVGLKDVFAVMSEATLLFGPDTFTSHIAASMGIPQVTLILPEHHAWCNAASRSFYVKWNLRRQDLVEAAAERMAYLLQEGRPEDAVLRDTAATWRQCLDQLRRHIQSRLSHHAADPRETILPVVQTLRQLLQGAPEIVARTLAPRCPDRGFDGLQRLVQAPDAMSLQSMVRLYHTSGVSDLSGVLYCLEWKEARHACA